MTTLTRTLLIVALALPTFVNASERPTLTREEVEQCVADRNDVVARNEVLSAQKVQLDVRGDALIENEARIKQGQASLKPDLAQLQTHQDELKRRANDMAAYFEQAKVVKGLSAAYKDRVDRSNADVRAHQVLLDQYNADVIVFNQQRDLLEVKELATNKRCTNKAAKRADIDAAKAAAEQEAPRTQVLTPQPRVLP